jgi:hypothetical protein
VKQSEFHTRKIELLERATDEFGMVRDALEKFSAIADLLRQMRACVRHLRA